MAHRKGYKEESFLYAISNGKPTVNSGATFEDGDYHIGSTLIEVKSTVQDRFYISSLDVKKLLQRGRRLLMEPMFAYFHPYGRCMVVPIKYVPEFWYNHTCHRETNEVRGLVIGASEGISIPSEFLSPFKFPMIYYDKLDRKWLIVNLYDWLDKVGHLRK